ARQAEEAFICSLFHGLGELLARYYFPEESEEIRKLVDQKRVPLEAASRQVLGLSFEELGMGIAQAWGFPASIVGSMRRLPPGPVRKPVTHDDGLRLLAGFSNELCEAIAGTPEEERHQAMAAVTERFAGGLPFTEPQLKAVLEKSMEDLGQIAGILHVNLKQSTFAKQVRTWTSGVPVPAAAGAAGAAAAGRGAERTLVANGEAALAETVLGEHSLVADGAGPDADDEDEDSAAGVPDDAERVLAAGIQDISNSLVEEAALNDIMRIVLETMYRAMGFKRVLLCLRDAKSGLMVGRFGFGPDAAEIVRQFRFPLSYTPDVFHVATSKAVDIFISDIDDPKIADRVPAWYRRSVPARTFVLFPMNIKGKPVAMIYCDKDRAGQIVIPEKELTLLKTLRNQALLAIKQAG
ncbi:MAG: HDOD domain-containing protein, partial [Rhodocyclaceae bacterium]|nr:HDOD domain-containing protein [Rhodocyclaceae bacterium]